MENVRIFVYECEWSNNSLLYREPVHPDYRGMHREGRWCYFFFSRDVDSYFDEFLKVQGTALRFSQRFEFPLSAWQRFVPHTQVGCFSILLASNMVAAATSGEERQIKLLPSISFGSGLHPSTQACLLAMEKAFAKHKPHIVFDLGTGCGILAIAALLLGAGRAIASDISLIAIKEAEQNARLNNLHSKLSFIAANGLLPVNASRIPLVMMNLEWPSLRSVFDNSSWWLCNRIIVCGFPRFLWPNLLRKLELSLFFTEDLLWVEDWGAVTIAQHQPPL
ncbi:MAG: 50S ribosomal protein L11 methyltransferase [Thermodesulforhabdaceae bacterium]